MGNKDHIDYGTAIFCDTNLPGHLTSHLRTRKGIIFGFSLTSYREPFVRDGQIYWRKLEKNQAPRLTEGTTLAYVPNDERPGYARLWTFASQLEAVKKAAKRQRGKNRASRWEWFEDHILHPFESSIDFAKRTHQGAYRVSKGER